MSREIAINFFEITNIKQLPEDYYRVTLKNQYVGTEDIDIILAFSSKPEIGQRVQVTMERC